jgi:hypothetical protein
MAPWLRNFEHLQTRPHLMDIHTSYDSQGLERFKRPLNTKSFGFDLVLDNDQKRRDAPLLACHEYLDQGGSI